VARNVRSFWAILIWLVLMIPVQLFLADQGAFAFHDASAAGRDGVAPGSVGQAQESDSPELRSAQESLRTMNASLLWLQEYAEVKPVEVQPCRLL
jgi:hypothetical protein